MSTTIKLTVDGAIGRLTFESPNGINILSTPVFDDLEIKLGQVALNRDVRVLVISGSGKTFLAGADISEMSAAPHHAGTEFAKRGRRAMDRIAGLDSAVTIAALNGGAFGGGCELAVACDMRIMSDKAKIALTETKLGLIPGWGGMQRAMELVGPSRARRMVFTADIFDAAKAAEIGLVNEAVPADQLDATVNAIAAQIIANGPHAVRLAKRCLMAAEQGEMAGRQAEAHGFGEAFASPEGREGLDAFLQKRAPKW